MEIRHKDGKIVDNKSSGAAIIVAISLISAIHKHAYISAPLILDAFTEGLDKKRTPNTIKELPRVSEQILFISTEKELDSDKARKWLGKDLCREFTLERISSQHSEIVRINA